MASDLIKQMLGQESAYQNSHFNPNLPDVSSKFGKAIGQGIGEVVEGVSDVWKSGKAGAQQKTEDIMEGAKRSEEAKAVQDAELMTQQFEPVQQQLTPDVAAVQGVDSLLGNEKPFDFNPQNYLQVEKIFNDAQERLPAVKVRAHKQILDELSDPVNFSRELGEALNLDNQVLTDRQTMALEMYYLSEMKELSDLAGNAVAGNDPLALMKFQEKALLVEALTLRHKQTGTESGRALRARREVLNLIERGDIESINKYMAKNQKSIVENAQTHEFIEANFPALSEVQENKLYELYSRTKPAQQFIVDWVKNGWLFNTTTQMVNAGGGFMINSTNALIMNPLSATYGNLRRYGRSNIVNDNDTYYTGFEALSRMSAYNASIQEASRDALTALIDANKVIGQDKERISSMDQVRHWIGELSPDDSPIVTTAKTGGHAATLFGDGAYKIMAGLDNFNKSMAFRESMVGQIVRQAREEGVEPKDLPDYVSKAMLNPDPAYINNAIDKANEVTFSGEAQQGIMNSMINGLREVENEVPLLQLFTAFMGTAGKITGTAVDYAAPVASQKFRSDIAQGGAARDEALAKLTFSALMWMGIASLYNEGRITGGGPRDYQLQKVMEKDGWQARSILVGDTYVEYRVAEPFATMASTFADAMDAQMYAPTEQEARNLAANLMFALYDHVGDMPMMQGMKNLQQVTNFRDPKKARDWMADMMVGSLPLSSQARLEARIADPVKRSLESDPMGSTGFNDRVSQILKNHYGQTKATLRPRRHWDGSIRGDMTPYWFNEESADINNKDGQTTIGQMASRFGARLSFLPTMEDKTNTELWKNGFTPREPAPSISIPSMKISLLDLDNNNGMVYDKYIEVLGQKRREVYDNLVQSDDYINATVADSYNPEQLSQYQLFEAADVQARGEAKEAFLTDELVPVLQKLQSEGAELSQIAMIILNEGDFGSAAQVMFDERAVLEKTIPNLKKRLKYTSDSKRDRQNVLPSTRIKPMGQ